MSDFPFITVVMPIRNEERYIASTLKQLLEQDYPRDRYEVIMADGMSDDRTREIVGEIAKEHPNVRLIDNPGMRSSSGRNVGFKNGKGDIFLVVDGHCYIPTDKLLKNIVECFDKSGAQCLGRPQPLDPPDLTEFQRAVALARASRIGHSGDSLIYANIEGFVSPVSNGAVYRREVFNKIGYVDEAFDACEDVEFNYRVEAAGFKTYMSQALTIKYYPRESLKGLFRQMVRYGKGRINFIKKHPETLNVDTLVPLLFACGFIITPVIGILWPFFVWTWALIYGLYLCLVLFSAGFIASREGWRYFKHLPAIYIVVHFGLGTGLARALTSAKR